MSQDNQTKNQFSTMATSTELAMSILGLPKGAVINDKENVINKISSLTVDIQRALRTNANRIVEQKKAEYPTLSRNDFRHYQFALTVNDIVAYNQKIQSVRYIRQRIREQLILLRSITVITLDNEGNPVETIAGFYNEFQYDKKNDIVLYELSDLAIKLWFPQLQGGQRKIRFGNMSKINASEKSLYEFVTNFILDNPDMYNDNKSEIVGLDLIRSFFAGVSPSINFGEFNRTHLQPAVKNIALYTDISFDIDKLEGERPTKHLSISNVHIDRNKIILSDTVEAITEIDTNEVRTPEDIVNAESNLFRGAAQGYGFKGEEVFVIDQLFKGDMNKLEKAHISFKNMQDVGLTNMTEFEFIMSMFKTNT